MPLATIKPARPTTLHVESLTPTAFAPFGTVIATPLPSSLTSYPPSIPPPIYRAHQPNPVPANQSTALKTSPISPLTNNYPANQGPGANAKPGTGLMSIFSSFPRQNTYLSTDKATGKQTLRLKLGILERHPYTTQTFCPFNYSRPGTRSTTPSATAADKTYMLIIVAPTTRQPSSNPPNPPDLSRIRAFLAPLNDPGTPNMAVTYGPGTWHAPMVVLGSRRVDFLVTQFANGVPGDDCQEVLIGEGPDPSGFSDDERRMRERGETGKMNVEVECELLARGG